MESNYYFHETSGILIRVETDWHLKDVNNEDLWQHWKIEKNLFSIDGENLGYTYVAPPAYKELDLTWPLITVGIGVVGIVVVLWILGIIPKKKDKKILKTDEGRIKT